MRLMSSSLTFTALCFWTLCAHAADVAQVPTLTLPESLLLSEETRAALRLALEREKELFAAEKSCPPMDGLDRRQMAANRQCRTEAFYRTAVYKDLRARYPGVMTPQELGGVYTEIFTPAEGIARKNEHRVLINVHGGGFTSGSRTASYLESVPLASVGKIKVVSIDYRQAPEYTFPAASEDVAAVYRALLKHYKPKNIGLYGCSAGGLLTAQAIAWFQKEGLPLPGAIGMFCEGADYWFAGDSGRISAARRGNASPEAIQTNAYFKDVDPNDPLAFPARSPEVMARFPPSLLISSTRDLALSSVVHTHSLLVKQGVPATLHVWEGLDHAFFTMLPDLPQSRDVHDVVARFFDRYLGR